MLKNASASFSSQSTIELSLARLSQNRVEISLAAVTLASILEAERHVDGNPTTVFHIFSHVFACFRIDLRSSFSFAIALVT